MNTDIASALATMAALALWCSLLLTVCAVIGG